MALVSGDDETQVEVTVAFKESGRCGHVQGRKKSDTKSDTKPLVAGSISF